MKLSEAVKKLKHLGFTREDALEKLKRLVIKADFPWNKEKQKIFDDNWNAKYVPQLSLDFGKKYEDRDTGQGAETAEERLTFFKQILRPCKFMPKEWSPYGLHAMREGSEKRPTNIKQAIDILTKHGFQKSHRSPMSPKFADRGAQRAVTFYSDKYGNMANTVSQVSDNGKNSFYILNVTLKLTREDRGKLNKYEDQLNKKYNIIIKKIDDKKK